MDAAALFERAMRLMSLRGFQGFAEEADLVRDAQTRMERKIAEVGLPYSVGKERPLIGGRADLVIFGDGGSVLVAAEFKYEPAHTGAMASDDVVLWPEVEADIEKIKRYVGEGGVGAAYAILVDADGRWLRRRPNPPAGSEWRDWSNGVWALWTKVSGAAAYKAPPAGGAPDALSSGEPRQVAAPGEWVPMPSPSGGLCITYHHSRVGGNPGGAERRSSPTQRPVIPAKAGTYWAQLSYAKVSSGRGTG